MSGTQLFLMTFACGNDMKHMGLSETRLYPSTEIIPFNGHFIGALIIIHWIWGLNLVNLTLNHRIHYRNLVGPRQT